MRIVSSIGTATAPRRLTAWLGLAVLGLAAVASGEAPVPATAPDACPAVTRIRFYPRQGFAKRMVRGRFSGSNESRTTEFQGMAEIKEAPAEGQWTEIKVEKPIRYRYIKYESPLASFGNVAEIEFYAGEVKIQGTAFGTTGSRENSGNDFTKAVDGDTATFFDGINEHNQYVGFDLGPGSQTAAPTFSPAAGSYGSAQTITITSTTPGAVICYSRSGGTPNPTSGDIYKAPIKLEKGAILSAVAYTDQLAASPVILAPYRIGEASKDSKIVRTFHIGNSLTDTVDGWLKPVAESGGHSLDFHRFTIPGAPTDWLWDHPGSGFGDSRFEQAFFVYAPFDHIFTQPFAGHDRAIPNEAEYSGKFFEVCRQHSPDVQAWLYVQWPGPDFKDRWSQGQGSARDLKLKPATTWQEGAANHVAYTEAVRDLLSKTWKGKPILIVPGGLALAQLKSEIEAGKVPGMTEFVPEIFADGIHLTAKGRYLVSLVFYGCIYKESPEGKVSPLTTKLTDEQAKIFQRIAWDTVKGYKYSGVSETK